MFYAFTHPHGDFEPSTGRLAGHPTPWGRGAKRSNTNICIPCWQYSTRTLAHARLPVSTLQCDIIFMWNVLYTQPPILPLQSSMSVVTAPHIHLEGKTVFGRVCSESELVVVVVVVMVVNSWWWWGGEESKRPSIMRETCALYVFVPHPQPDDYIVRAWTVSATAADAADDEINVNDETNEWHFGHFGIRWTKKKKFMQRAKILKKIYKTRSRHQCICIMYILCVQNYGRIRYLLQAFMYNSSVRITCIHVSPWYE